MWVWEEGEKWEESGKKVFFHHSISNLFLSYLACNHLTCGAYRRWRLFLVWVTFLKNHFFINFRFVGTPIKVKRIKRRGTIIHPLLRKTDINDKLLGSLGEPIFQISAHTCFPNFGADKNIPREIGAKEKRIWLFKILGFKIGFLSAEKID